MPIAGPGPECRGKEMNVGGLNSSSIERVFRAPSVIRWNVPHSYNEGRENLVGIMALFVL